MTKNVLCVDKPFLAFDDPVLFKDFQDLDTSSDNGLLFDIHVQDAINLIDQRFGIVRWHACRA